MEGNERMNERTTERDNEVLTKAKVLMKDKY